MKKTYTRKLAENFNLECQKIILAKHPELTGKLTGLGFWNDINWYRIQGLTPSQTVESWSKNHIAEE